MFTSDTLAGKVAIITGAGVGIGVGVAEALAEAGAAVVISYNSSATGRRSWRPGCGRKDIACCYSRAMCATTSRSGR